MKKPSEVIIDFAEDAYGKANGNPIGLGQNPSPTNILDGIIRYMDLPWYKKLLRRLGL